MNKTLRPVTISGIGYAVGEEIWTNQQVIERFGNDTTDEWVQKKLGIKSRAWAKPETQTSDLAARAARQALEMAGVKPEELGGILGALGIGDVRSPATACYLQHKLGAVNAWATDANTACAGWVLMAEIGRRFVADGTMDAFLAFGADIASRTKVDPSDRTLGLIFGDAAGAAVITPCKEGEGFITGYAKSDGSQTEVIGVEAGGSRVPLDEEAVRQKKHWTKMDGAGVWRNGIRGITDSINTACKQAGITPHDLDMIITHQANMRLIEAVMESANLPMDRTYTTVQKYGNSSSASPITTLAEAVMVGKVKPGMLVCIAGVGAGFLWGATILRWTCGPA